MRHFGLALAAAASLLVAVGGAMAADHAIPVKTAVLTADTQASVQLVHWGWGPGGWRWYSGYTPYYSYSPGYNYYSYYPYYNYQPYSSYYGGYQPYGTYYGGYPYRGHYWGGGAFRRW